jgi:hypothetical protein
MFSWMNVFQENEESKTDAVCGKGDLITEELESYTCIPILSLGCDITQISL